MSLIGSLSIGKSALAVHQAAIQTTGNNISNAGNADYTRQVTNLGSAPDQRIGDNVFVGTGVQINAIARQIDDALEGRLRAATSDSQAAQTTEQWVGQVEATFNELSDSDLSTRLSQFFGSWSNLANKPQDVGLRQVVVQNGQAVAGWLNDVRGQLTGLQSTIDSRLPAIVGKADALTNDIAALNTRIANAEAGNGVANNLRDQRDASIKELATLIDVKTIEQPNGMTNVFVGSEPLVTGSDSRGLTLVSTGGGDAASGNQPIPEIRFKANMGTVSVKSGQMAGLLTSRQEVVQAVKDVDTMAGALVFDLNKIHSSGQGLQGYASVTAQNAVADQTVALNDAKTGLSHVASNGSFVVHVKEKASGLVTSTLVQVDLDGLNGDDTTLNGLAGALGGIAGLDASVNAGKLTLAADSGAVEISFSQDSSGVLASLGINNFFTGKDASDIAVNQTIKDDPQMLAASKNGEKGDNQTARLIAALEGQPLAGLGGQSLKDRYETVIGRIANTASTAKTDAESTQGVLETLATQRDAISGVSLDEEAVNLMREQRAFQGAARLITTVNELMDVVLNMAR